MVKTSWKLGQSGLWTDPDAWSGDIEPNSSSNVVIASAPAIAGVPYTITLQGNAAVHALSQVQGAASLNISAGTLSVAGTYALAAGTLSLHGAALQGGTLSSTAGTIVIGGVDTLSGVSLNGAFSITGATPGMYAQLSLLNDGFRAMGGHGAGALVLGADVAVALGINPALNNVALTLDSDTLEQAGATLTIGDTASVNATGQTVLGDANALTNKGAITDGGTGSVLTIDATAMLNQGTMAVSNGGNLLLDGDTFDNTGLVAIGLDSYLRIQTINPAGFVNSGSIAVSGGTLSLDTALTTAQLATLPVASGTLAISGTLDNTGAVLRSGSGTGSANLSLEGGTITAGTIVNTGSFSVGVAPLAVGNPYDAPDSVLSGVTLDGALNVAGAGAKLDIAGGITLNGASSVGPGIIDVGGPGASVTFIGSQRVENVRIALGSVSPQDLQEEQLIFEAPASGNNTLTLGTHVVVTQTGLDVGIGTTAYPGVIDFQGVVNAAVRGGTFTVSGCDNAGRIAVSGGDTLNVSNVVNTGTISSNGAQLTIDGAVTNAGMISVSGTPPSASAPPGLVASGFTNTGVLNVSNGATASLDGNWGNTGLFAVSNGELLLGGSFSRAELGAVQMGRGGTLGVLGTLTATGSTLAVGAGTAIPALMLDGTVVGGSIYDAGGAVQFVAATTLDGLSYQGTLSIGRPLATVTVKGGLTLTGAGNRQFGSLSLTGSGAALDWDSTEAFDNALVSIGGPSTSYGSPAIVAAPDDPKPVLLGRHLRVQQAGTCAAIGSSTGTFVSDATLTANVTHGQFALGGSAFTNTGTIGIAGGDTVSASAAGFANAGLIVVETGSALDLNLYNYFASHSLAAESFANSGSICMAGGTLTELTGGGLFPDVPLLNMAGARIAGAGVVASQIDNDGLIEAHGGVLNLEQTVSGAGAVLVDPGATLVLGGVGHAQTVRFAGSGGVLGLQPAAFLGTIGGFAAGDTIDLSGTAGHSAVFSGDMLTVALTDGGTLSLPMTSALTGSLSVTAGSHGDTLIRYTGGHTQSVLNHLTHA